MDQAVKEQWLKALRSGEYPQTTNTLRRMVATDNAPVGFCCLGVLCDIAVKNEVIEGKVARDTDKIMTYDEGFYGFLPDKVVKWSGLDLDLGGDMGVEFTYGRIRDLIPEEIDQELGWGDGARTNVADLNDRGVDFATIANIIERVF